MFKFKRGLALLLAGTLVFSMAGCGKSDKEEKDSKKKANKSAKSVDTIGDALALGQNYQYGDYSIKVSLDMDIPGTEGSMEFSAAGTVAGEDETMGFGIDLDMEGVDVSFDFKDLVALTDGKIYFNVDSFLGAISGEDTEFGYYAIPAPEVETKGADKLTKVATDLINATFADSDVEKDGDTFTVELKDAGDYEKVVRNLFDYLDKNQDDIEKAVNGFSSTVDLEKYAKEVIDYTKEDIVEAVGLLGGEISESDLEDLADELGNLDIEDVEANLFEGFDEAKEEIDDLDSDDFEEAFEDVDIKTVMTVTANEDEFSYKLSLTIKADDGEMTMAIDYKIKVDDDAKVKAPKNESTLTDMVKYATDNPEVLEDVLAGIQEVFGAFSTISDDYDDWDDDFNWDDDDYNFDDDDSQSVSSDVVNDGTYELNVGGKVQSFDYDTKVLEYSYASDTSATLYSADNATYISVSTYVWEDYEYDYLVNYYATSYANGESKEVKAGDFTVSYVYEKEYEEYYLIATADTLGDDILVSYVYVDDDVKIEDVIKALYK